jgi:hypothetical protein
MEGKVTKQDRKTTSSRSRRDRIGTGGLVAVVNGGLAGVGGVYASTHSIVVTIVAGLLAIVLALMVLVFDR